MLSERGHAEYEKREQEFGEQLMRDLERMVLLRNVDTLWMDHIDAMDELRRGIGLRAYGQHDPVVEYREVGSDMFEEMNTSIRENTVRMMLTVRVRSEEETKRQQVAKVTTTSSGSSDGSEKGRTVRNAKKKVGPNDPCPCGSGKKYKNCCGDVRKNND
jgi:preprotein translocase subunit SecA